MGRRTASGRHICMPQGDFAIRVATDGEKRIEIASYPNPFAFAGFQQHLGGRRRLNHRLEFDAIIGCQPAELLEMAWCWRRKWAILVHYRMANLPLQAIHTGWRHQR